VPPSPPASHAATLGDLLIAILLQHLARIAVAPERGRYFFSRSAEIDQHDFSGGERRQLSSRPNPSRRRS
jgi:hypothetical protein